MPLLSPTPGRVGVNQSGLMEFDGETYRVEPTRHGLLRSRAWRVSERSESHLIATCGVDCADTPPDCFDFHFSARHTVQLRDHRLYSTVEIQSQSKRDQPVDMGWHPYFQRPAEASLSMPATRRLVLDGEAEPTPTGVVRDVGVRDDFRQGRRLSSDDSWDDVFMGLGRVDQPVEVTLDGVDRVEQPNGSFVAVRTQRYLRLGQIRPSTGPCVPIDFVQVYTPPRRRAIALEPLSAAPNAINLSSTTGGALSFTRLGSGESCAFDISLGIRLVGESM